MHSISIHMLIDSIQAKNFIIFDIMKIMIHLPYSMVISLPLLKRFGDGMILKILKCIHKIGVEIFLMCTYHTHSHENS